MLAPGASPRVKRSLRRAVIVAHLSSRRDENAESNDAPVRSGDDRAIHRIVDGNLVGSRLRSEAGELHETDEWR